MIGRIVHKFCPQAAQRLRLCTATSQNNILTKSLIMKFQDSIQPTSRGFHRSVPANIKVQGPAPDFKGLAVVDSDFKEIQLSDFKGKYLVVFFYPLDFTFVCPTEIIAFSDRINDFKALDTAVVGVSCDSHFSHLAWINTPRKSGGLGGLNYPLLSDFSKSIARDYNVLIESEGVPLRGLFIINPEGIVRQITVNDLPVGRSVDEILRLIKAFKFTDEHGEVCPANWNPESPTIKPTPNGSQEYFAKVN